LGEAEEVESGRGDLKVRLAMSFNNSSFGRMRKNRKAEEAMAGVYVMKGLPSKEGIRQALIARAGSLRAAYKIFSSEAKNTPAKNGRKGLVTLPIFQAGLAKLGIDTSEILGRDVKEVFAELDEDHSGDLTLTEIIGYYSDFDEELLRITSEGYLPTKLLWARYVNQVNSSKVSLNRAPRWSSGLNFSSVQQLLDDYEAQRLFEQQSNALRRQLRESHSNELKESLLRELGPLVSGQPQQSTLVQTHQRAQRIAQQIHEIYLRRRELKGISAEAADVVGNGNFGFSETPEDEIGSFGIPLTEVAYLRSLFETYANDQGRLYFEDFRRLSMEITRDEPVPARQFLDWWNASFKHAEFCEFDQLLGWYAQFIC
jgi:Ca2+-binding EF-hand superfamily protein